MKEPKSLLFIYYAYLQKWLSNGRGENFGREVIVEQLEENYFHHLSIKY